VERGDCHDDECFSSGPWTTMLQDLDLSHSKASALLKYNIATALQQVSLNTIYI